MIISLKICFKCHIEKPLSEFYRHPQMADGHLNKCKDCTRKDNKIHYDNNFTNIQQYEKNRFKTTSRKQSIIRYQKNRRHRIPEKRKAWRCVYNALKTGKLQEQPCRDCGGLNVQAHHADYSKPLEVVWLCFVCHRKNHGQLNHRESALFAENHIRR